MGDLSGLPLVDPLTAGPLHGSLVEAGPVEAGGSPAQSTPVPPVVRAGALLAGFALGLLIFAAPIATAPDVATRFMFAAVWAPLALALPLLVTHDMASLRLPSRIIAVTACACSTGALATVGLGHATLSDLLGAVVCAAGLAAAMAVMRAVYEITTGRPGLGGGDVRLAGLIGGALGFGEPVNAIMAVGVYAPLSALILLPAIHLLPRRVRASHPRTGSRLTPYGPMLAAGALMAMLAPDLWIRLVI